MTEATPLGDDFLVNTAAGGLVLVRDGREAASTAAPDRRAGARATASGAYVLCLLHGADATEVAALRAADLAEVARAPLPSRRGGARPFVAGVAPTLDEIRSAETLARLYARKASGGTRSTAVSAASVQGCVSPSRHRGHVTGRGRCSTTDTRRREIHSTVPATERSEKETSRVQMDPR